MAVECHDYPQLFDLGASPGARLAQLADNLQPAARRRLLAVRPLDLVRRRLESYDWCVRWPAPTHPPDPPRPPGAAYPAVPTLLLNGESPHNVHARKAERVEHGDHVVDRGAGP